MTQTKYIVGAKGGKGGSGSTPPTEADDTLQSVQFANVLDLISEGEIQGLDDGFKSIFLDDTPVENEDGTFNFIEGTIATRVGTQDQLHIPGPFNSVESETLVNTLVEKDTPVTRSVTGPDTDRVRVTLTIPSLQILEDDGDIVGHKVRIRIFIKYTGETDFTKVIGDTIRGKSSNRYQRDYLIKLTGTLPAELRVVRVSMMKQVRDGPIKQFGKVLLRLLTLNFVIPTRRWLDCVLILDSFRQFQAASI